MSSAMKAVRVITPGGPENLAIVHTRSPELKEDEILLKVMATAVNRADIIQRQGAYPPPAGVTDILGLEAAGIVHSIGPRCTGSWKVGDRAMALVSGGAYAEYVAVKETHILPIPSTLSFCAAAAIPEAWLTAYQLLSKVANCQHEESVLIHAAASGVGTAAVQLVNNLFSGAVFATTGSNDKVDFVKNLGAQYAFNYKTDGDFAEFVKKGTNGRGVDVILDCVGGSYWKQNCDSLAMDGRWIVYGLMGGPNVDGDILRHILRKRAQIKGTTLRNRSDQYKTHLISEFSANVLPLFEAGTLLPITDKLFPLEQVADAHRYVEQNVNIGKVVLKVADDPIDQ